MLLFLAITSIKTVEWNLSWGQGLCVLQYQKELSSAQPPTAHNINREGPIVLPRVRLQQNHSQRPAPAHSPVKPQECSLHCRFFQLTDFVFYFQSKKLKCCWEQQLYWRRDVFDAWEAKIFLHTPVWCTAKGTKYHTTCGSADFQITQLFSLRMKIILL